MMPPPSLNPERKSGCVMSPKSRNEYDGMFPFRFFPCRLPKHAGKGKKTHDGHSDGARKFLKSQAQRRLKIKIKSVDLHSLVLLFSFEKSIRPTQADLQILEDKDYYRVFNQTVSTFNDNNTSYFHNSVGGYSAAKLIRYQDLIENHLSKGNMNAFNMLNTKYFIGGQPGQELAQQNPSACGSAWFVENIKWVKNADEEMAALTTFLPQSTVVIDERFKDNLKDFTPNNSSQNKITLTSFHPDKMVYATEANTDNFAVFSEIWYKGNEDWKAYIDGVETKFLRVNYLLRGLKIPGGTHEVVFEFHPKTYYVGSEITRYASIFFLLLVIAVLAAPLVGKKLPGMEYDS